MSGECGGGGGAEAGRRGLSEVRDLRDLRPVLNDYPVGRRADPKIPGKYLSVSVISIYRDNHQVHVAQVSSCNTQDS